MPYLVKYINKLDLFLHDSLHINEHIRFELSTVITKSVRGSWILADDVDEVWSLEFLRFCRGQGLRHVVLGRRLGVARV